jgi:hypothetical protein
LVEGEVTDKIEPRCGWTIILSKNIWSCVKIGKATEIEARLAQKLIVK